MNEIEELRRWSAEKLMGWIYRDAWEGYVLSYGYEIIQAIEVYEIDDDESPNGKRMIPASTWQPDNPHTGQIWMVIDKMRELGWFFGMDDFGKTDPITLELIGSEIYEAEFLHNKHGSFSLEDPNPCLAILKAAKAALEGGDTK